MALAACSSSSKYPMKSRRRPRRRDACTLSRLAYSSHVPLVSPPRKAPMREKIYVAGPYTKGDVAENVHKAFKAANDLADLGFAPFVPHGHTSGT